MARPFPQMARRPEWTGATHITPFMAFVAIGGAGSWGAAMLAGSDRERKMTKIDGNREHLIETYRKTARHYDITSQLYQPQWAHRRKAVQALRLHRGATVVEIACGTGLNFALLQREIGPEGRIVGVDLTDAMLAQAQQRIEANAWRNVSLVQADAAEFEFPTGVDAILATYPHALLPDARQVIAHGAAALSAGGSWVVLDLKVPDSMPRWLTRLAIAAVGQSASLEEWIVRRPWEAIRLAMKETLADLTWTELLFGIAYLAVGSRGPRTVDECLPAAS
jgi:ubiquinone/menaquinone biosynthesis C-methylase UbiE